MTATEDTGRLVLVGAPLGDPGDASARVRDTLRSADIVAAGDPERLAGLTRYLGVPLAGRVVAYREGDARSRTAELVGAMIDGASVVLVTDGAAPDQSDPGYRLVQAALAAGVPVTAAPGPSAVIAALAVSGLPGDRFCVEGPLPRPAGERRTRLGALAAETRTLVFVESGQHLADTLADLVDAFGGSRPAAACRELTGTGEKVVRGTLTELAGWAAGASPAGEVTLVLGGAPAAPARRPSDAELVVLVAEHQTGGTSRKDAIAAVAAAYGLPKRDVYEAVLRAKP